MSYLYSKSRNNEHWERKDRYLVCIEVSLRQTRKTTVITRIAVLEWSIPRTITALPYGRVEGGPLISTLLCRESLETLISWTTISLIAVIYPHLVLTFALLLYYCYLEDKWPVVHIRRTAFLNPFKSNGMSSWWHFFFWFEKNHRSISLRVSWLHGFRIFQSVRIIKPSECNLNNYIVIWTVCSNYMPSECSNPIKEIYAVYMQKILTCLH